MSKGVRGRGQAQVPTADQSQTKLNQAPQSTIRAAARSPLSHAAVSMASMMFVSGAAAQQSSTSLPTIDVVGDNTTYQTTNQSITRLPTPLRDTPQTVNIVPKQVIQEQRMVTMEDALRYVPGITFSAGEGSQQGDGPIIRGFVARGDLFRDGIRDPGWHVRDLFNSDRVEVYKGPSAYAFGRGSTGGAINTVSKLPTDSPFAETALTGTTGPGFRAEVDASGKKDNFSGRIAGLYMDADTPTRDNIYVKRWGVAPSVTYQMNQTKFTLSYIYQGEESVPDYGFTYLPQPAFSPATGAMTNPGYYGNGTPVTPVPAPRQNWFGIPNGPLRDITEVDTHILTGKIEHEFNSSFKLVNATRFMENERFSRATAPRSLGNAANVVFASGTGGGIQAPNYPPDLMTIGRERRERQTNNTFLINQTDFIAKFDTGQISHSFVAGIEFSRETRNQSRFDLCNPTNIACRTSVFAPDPNGSPVGGQVLHLPNSTDARTAAGYVVDQMKFNRYFEFLGSVRFDRFASRYDDTDQAVPANRHFERTDNMWSYRFGPVFHLTPNSSIYASYGNSYNPSAELGTITNASQAALAPEQTKTIEVGTKVDLLHDRLSLTGAVFHIKKYNLRINDPLNNTVTILDGVARVLGFEVGATGKLTNRWSIFSGYSYLDTLIKDTPDQSILNRQLPNAPRHTFTLWTTYDIAPQWTIGGGAIYNSMGWANQTNTAYVPDYWKFDAMLAYKLSPNSTVQLNVYNITDKFYYAQYFGSNVVPGSGRWASLTWRYRF